ncbi:MAG TPA: M56 family metallopeptidase [Pirellulales bacterium]|nr:M56 family metallopeptidase [Pirellulales bacterium]
MNGFTSLLNCAWEWSAEALLLSISAAGSAALLAALVAAINVCGRRWLSARQMGLLWGLVLLRLLVPFAPPGFFSLQNLLISVQSEAGKSVDEVRTADVGYAEPQPNPTPSNDYAASPAPINNAEPGDQFSLLEDWLSLALPFVWVLGAATTLLGTAVVHWRFCQHLKRMPVSNDARLCRLWTSARRLARVRRSLPIVLTDSVDQPAVTGVFRPKLLLPEHATELSDDQLRMIMLHELAHFRRWHVAGNWALVVVRAFHWWNPLYWFAAARFQSLREQACDAFAVQRMEGCPTRSYGELLLTLAGHRQARASWRIVLPVSILGFFSAFFRKHAVRNRIAALRTAGIKRSRLHTAAIGGLIALAAACGLTDAGTPEAPAKPGWDWLSIDAVRDWNDWHGSSEAESGETVVRYYDLGKALRRIAEDEQISDASRMLKWQVIALLGGYEPDRSNPSVANVKRGYEERVVIDGAALKVDAPVVVQAEVERNIRAWEQGGLAIAVGMALAGHPPHRSVLEELPHTAPTLSRA